MKKLILVILLISFFSINADTYDAKEIFLFNLVPLEKVSENENESIDLHS